MAQALERAVAGAAYRFMSLQQTSNHSVSLDESPISNWCDEAEYAVMRDLNVLSIPRLQIILILIYDRMALGKLATVWHLVSMASRIAYGLKLNHPTEKVPFTNQECRRRLMCHCPNKAIHKRMEDVLAESRKIENARFPTPARAKHATNPQPIGENNSFILPGQNINVLGSSPESLLMTSDPSTWTTNIDWTGVSNFGDVSLPQLDLFGLQSEDLYGEDNHMNLSDGTLPLNIYDV
ncbi:hypothetical protein N7456_009160 [Penicillium angulare]|uniref:Uncharacterized protein n=1 Tax=Penicillium angulare TaxID=116970 RepID=A0A9W9K508_9EURO|nr:hypothetical protein N7456_009160 [Penicillium angulare]